MLGSTKFIDTHPQKSMTRVSENRGIFNSGIIGSASFSFALLSLTEGDDVPGFGNAKNATTNRIN